MGRRVRKAPEPMVNGLRPTIAETGDAGPERFTLTCPVCGEVSRHPFELLARRAFEEHADEEHPAGDSPLEQVRSLVDLVETDPGRWECALGPQTYLVRGCDTDRFEVVLAGRRAVIEVKMSTLDDVRIAIGAHAGLVGRALADAAAIEAGRVCVSPDNVVPLE
ncbi:hypothetical protein [Streptomyces sp. NRRL S-241]|uniref:hypothetical protein n=1 Tax=Streptomyces sp. NRRL S-241 TaxID=1463896 RepID=UPI00131D0AD6|nr:hypothetical protein [Streptomyces sp. NRRL S-241]